MVWVPYRNDGSNTTRLSDPMGIPATVWASAFAEAHAHEVAPCPISGWTY